MKKEIKSKIYRSMFEHPVQENYGTILKFFISIVGTQAARDIFTLINSNSQKGAEAILHSALKESFPSLENLSTLQFEKKIIDLQRDSNNIIKRLIKCLPNLSKTISLLDNMTSTNPDLIGVISSLQDTEGVDPRFQYELLRQNIFAIIILMLEELDQEVEKVKIGNKIQKLFEKELYIGKEGKVNDKTFYSIHNYNNDCIISFDSLTEAQRYINKHQSIYHSSYPWDIRIQQDENLHIKSHSWSTRSINEIGSVSANHRIKEPYSTVRKLTYLEHNDRSTFIKPERMYNSSDAVGFMFVVDNENKDDREKKRNKLATRILNLIRANYPNAKFTPKHTVGTSGDRGQAKSLVFTRFIITLEDNQQPIELMIMDREAYENYIYSFREAHDIYNLNKSSGLLKQVFPASVYTYPDGEKAIEEIIENSIDIELKKIKRDLYAKKRIE